MWALGIPVTVTIDDLLPLDSEDQTIFAGIGSDKSLWVPLLEKALAKFNGNYEAIVGGTPETALSSLIGSPGGHFMHTNIDSTWQFLSDASSMDCLITVGAN